MSLFIIPLEPIRRLVHKGAMKIFGKEELEDLRANLVVPMTTFADEVYDDAVVDMLNRRAEKQGPA